MTETRLEPAIQLRSKVQRTGLFQVNATHQVVDILMLELGSCIMLSSIRWINNDVAGTDVVSHSAIFLTLLVLYIPVCLLGWTVTFIMLVVAQAGQGGVVLVFDLIGLPAAFPLVALIFVPIGRRLVRQGRFGLLYSILLGMFAVFVSTGLLGYLTLRTELGLWLVLPMIHYAMTYGFPLGALVWRRLTVEQPAIFLLPPLSPPGFGRALLVCAVSIASWQLLALLLLVLGNGLGVAA